MRLSQAWIALAVVVVLTACADEDRPQEVVSDSSVAGPWAEPDLVGDPAAMAPMGGMVAQMNPIEGSGVGGEITITDRANQTEVMVRLTGTAPSGSHPGHIHSGTCENIGGVVQALEPIIADNTGTGTMTTTVNIPPMTLMSGNHVVVYHGDGGSPITCAAIPAHVM